MKSPLVSRDPRLKKPPTEFELANELDPIGCATDNGRVMTISQIVYSKPRWSRGTAANSQLEGLWF